MANTMQEYLADASLTASDKLIAAYRELPEDKRNWKPSETSRTALDLVVECVILTDYTTKVIKDRKWDFEATKAYTAETEKLALLSWETLQALLKENVKAFAETARETPDDVLTLEMDTDFGKMTIADLLSYPYWNMSYHLGQINYIAGLTGK